MPPGSPNHENHPRQAGLHRRQLRLTSGGNLGIGTGSTVNARLHVKGSADDQQLIVQGAASQIANLQEWQNSSGTAISYVSPAGMLAVNPTNISGDLPTGTNSAFWVKGNSVFDTGNAAGVAINIKGRASQTADLLQGQDSTAAVLFRFDKSGHLGIGGSPATGVGLYVADGKYAQLEDNNAGAPPAADCDADSERGRISLDTTSNRLYICMRATRGWDYSALTDCQEATEVHGCNFDAMKPELVSQRIRLAVREEFVGWKLAQIGDLFTAEGFSPDLDYSPQVGGERRSYVEQFYVRIDWTDWDACRRYLRVVEAVLDDLRDRQVHDAYADAIEATRQKIVQLLQRDGFVIDEHGSIRARWEIITQESVQALPDESAIPGHLRRMWDNIEERPEQCISAAKDAIESTAKHALSTVGIELTGKEKVPALVDRVQKELRLHPTTVAPDQKGADAIIALLGSLANIANKVDEFRNLYGDGHGRAKKVAGLTPRHGRLVARCTDAYVGMILDTLASPSAPWRRDRDVPVAS